MSIKVLTVVGTRPELVKLSCVIPAMDRAFDHVLVHTGQNYDYELNQVFFEGLKLRKPDYFLDSAGKTPAATIARVMERVDEVLATERPDAMLLLGDTNSCLAAIVAKRRKVAVFHMEAGNRCFDDRVPEEINRRIVDHVSDINLPYSEHARGYLISEGIRPETIVKTGSPMKQVIAAQRASIAQSKILAKLKLSKGRFFLASAHREENVDSPVRLKRLLEALELVAEHHKLPVIVSTHPRTRARLQALGEARLDRLSKRLRFIMPVGFADYIRLQVSARCVLSDSGTLTEESSILGFPAVMLRESHERPEGMDEAVVPMCGLDPVRIADAVTFLAGRGATAVAGRRIVADYDVDDVASKVVNAIRSYTDYVSRTVWRRY